MLVIIAYDVETSTQEGRTRLRKVAKLCVNYGQRVQNSVFECSVDPAQLVKIKHQLEKMIDPDSDNIIELNGIKSELVIYTAEERG